jgi:hypothetical protein
LTGTTWKSRKKKGSKEEETNPDTSQTNQNAITLQSDLHPNQEEPNQEKSN